MLRKLIALQIFVYAIVFAFAAMSALRWPSIMMLAHLLFSEALPDTVETVNWRLLGILHGGAWMVAAFCYYAAATTVSRRRKGSVVWFICALAASLPCLVILKFQPDFTNGVSARDGAILGGIAGAALLLAAVWELRQRPPATASETTSETNAALNTPEAIPEKPRRRLPPGPAILRQRAAFARDGRRYPVKRPRIRLRWA